MNTKDELLKLLMSNPHDWDIGEFYAYHKKSGCRFWIANGFIFFQSSGPDPRLGIFRMWTLWRYLMDVPSIKTY